MAKKEQESSFEVRDRRRFQDGETAESDSGANASGDQAVGSAPPETEPAEPTHDHTGEGTPTAASSAEEAATANGAADQPDGTVEDEAGGEDDQTGYGMPDISVADMLQFTAASLAQMAWQNMGLISNPATGKVEARLDDARLAIDAIAALLPVLQPRMDEGGRREAQTLLSNLRLNFVEQSRRRANEAGG